MESPNRDQQTTRKALAEFQDLLRLYPTSPYATGAREEMISVLNNLAEHEFLIARFYYRFSRERSSVLSAAVERLESISEKYPDYPEPDKIQAYMCLCLNKATLFERALEECEKMRNEHPDSAYLKKLPKNIVVPPPKAEAASTEGESEEKSDEKTGEKEGDSP